jgi:stalled ribosome rescue protein Dom34
MIKMRRKRGHKRGYPVVLLVGFEVDRAVLWRVFSYVVKPCLTLKLDGKRMDKRVLYNFHEALVDALRPVLREGVRSIVVMAPVRTTYAADFLDHVRRHHAYLIKSNGSGKVTFAELVGSADKLRSVATLLKTEAFRRLVAQTTSVEADHLVNVLEKHLCDSKAVVLFSLKEIEDVVCGRGERDDFKVEYLVLTDRYLADSEDKSRVNRLLQISENRKMKTRIIEGETSAGKRISQFGGIIFFAVPAE